MECRCRVLFAALAVGSTASFLGCGAGSTPETSTASIPALGTADAKPSPPTKPKPRPPENRPKIVLQTSMGELVLQLDAEKAPQTVSNFLTYVNEGHFDQTLLHQVVKGSVIVGGTYGANLVEKKTHPPIRNEAHNGLKNRRGTIAMARRADAVDSATSQFFINLADNAWLDHQSRTLKDYGYCVFGQVVAGMDVVDRIAAVEVRQAGEFEHAPVQPVLITFARRQP